jgi:hypothetical protein
LPLLNAINQIQWQASQADENANNQQANEVAPQSTDFGENRLCAPVP